jgi:hypothetical protein
MPFFQHWLKHSPKYHKDVSFSAARLWGTLTGGLCVETATIPADNLDFGMAAQSIRACVQIAILKDVDNGAPVKIDDHGAVILRLSPAPVIDANDPWRRGIFSGRVEPLANDRVITDLNAQSLHGAHCLLVFTTTP